MNPIRLERCLGARRKRPQRVPRSRGEAGEGVHTPPHHRSRRLPGHPAVRQGQGHQVRQGPLQLHGGLQAREDAVLDPRPPRPRQLAHRDHRGVRQPEHGDLHERRDPSPDREGRGGALPRHPLRNRRSLGRPHRRRPPRRGNHRQGGLRGLHNRDTGHRRPAAVGLRPGGRLRARELVQGSGVVPFPSFFIDYPYYTEDLTSPDQWRGDLDGFLRIIQTEPGEDGAEEGRPRADKGPGEPQ